MDELAEDALKVILADKELQPHYSRGGLKSDTPVAARILDQLERLGWTRVGEGPKPESYWFHLEEGLAWAEGDG